MSTSLSAPLAPITPLLVDADSIAKLTGTSIPTVRRWDAGARMPEGISISPGCKRWRVADISLWIEFGCPDRKTFETQKTAKSNNTFVRHDNETTAA